MDPMPNMTGNCPMEDMMMMKMYFYFGYQCQPLLFNNFTLDTPGKLFGGFLFVIVVAILYEGLKTLREFLGVLWEDRKKSKAAGEEKPLVPKSNNSSDNLLQFSQPKSIFKAYFDPHHILQSNLMAIQVAIGYLLMLVAMTYNLWLFMAVCIGAGLGYYIFGKCRKSTMDFKTQSEHCH